VRHSMLGTRSAYQEHKPVSHRGPEQQYHCVRVFGTPMHSMALNSPLSGDTYLGVSILGSVLSETQPLHDCKHAASAFKA
jgi:hypothetical protein